MENYRRQVMYYETDRMGIVHNSNYLRYFEEARLDHMRQCGVPYPQLEKQGVIIPQLKAEIRYVSPLSYGDSFSVTVTVTDYTGTRIGYAYKISNESNGRVAAEGRTSHCFLDEEKRMPIDLGRRLPELSARLGENAD